MLTSQLPAQWMPALQVVPGMSCKHPRHARSFVCAYTAVAVLCIAAVLAPGELLVAAQLPSSARFGSLTAAQHDGGNGGCIVGLDPGCVPWTVPDVGPTRIVGVSGTGAAA